jgi:hypothetical protein
MSCGPAGSKRHGRADASRRALVAPSSRSATGGARSDGPSRRANHHPMRPGRGGPSRSVSLIRQRRPVGRRSPLTWAHTRRDGPSPNRREMSGCAVAGSVGSPPGTEPPWKGLSPPGVYGRCGFISLRTSAMFHDALRRQADMASSSLTDGVCSGGGLRSVSGRRWDGPDIGPRSTLLCRDGGLSRPVSEVGSRLDTASATARDPVCGLKVQRAEASGQ